MELILKNETKNTNKILLITVVLTLMYGFLTYSNKETKTSINLNQQNYLYNSVDTFSVR